MQQKNINLDLQECFWHFLSFSFFSEQPIQWWAKQSGRSTETGFAQVAFDFKSAIKFEGFERPIRTFRTDSFLTNLHTPVALKLEKNRRISLINRWLNVSM